MLNIGG